MTHCIRCHRPLKKATATGMGPVCAKRAPPMLPAEERGLFGYDIDKAEAAAKQRIAILAASLVVSAHAAVRARFRAARVSMGVWSA